jgi:hypothetical protein
MSQDNASRSGIRRWTVPAIVAVVAVVVVAAIAIAVGVADRVPVAATNVLENEDEQLPTGAGSKGEGVAAKHVDGVVKDPEPSEIIEGSADATDAEEMDNFNKTETPPVDEGFSEQEAQIPEQNGEGADGSGAEN